MVTAGRLVQGVTGPRERALGASRDEVEPQDHDL
jgi:hypothetical protein